MNILTGEGFCLVTVCICSPLFAKLKPSFRLPQHKKHRLQRRGRASHAWQTVRHAPRTRSSSVEPMLVQIPLCNKVRQEPSPSFVVRGGPKSSLILNKLPKKKSSHISPSFIHQILPWKERVIAVQGLGFSADVASKGF